MLRLGDRGNQAMAEKLSLDSATAVACGSSREVTRVPDLRDAGERPGNAWRTDPAREGGRAGPQVDDRCCAAERPVGGVAVRSSPRSPGQHRLRLGRVGSMPAAWQVRGRSNRQFGVRGPARAGTRRGGQDRSAARVLVHPLMVAMASRRPSHPMAVPAGCASARSEPRGLRRGLPGTAPRGRGGSRVSRWPGPPNRRYAADRL